MSVEKLLVLFVSSFPGGELLHVETEGLVTECIHNVCGANNRKVSTTSSYVRRSREWVSTTCTQKQPGR